MEYNGEFASPVRVALRGRHLLHNPNRRPVRVALRGRPFLPRLGVCKD